MLRVGLPNVKLNSNKSNNVNQTKMYHSTQDTVRKKMMIDLNKLENDRKTVVKNNEPYSNREFNREFNRDFNGNGNGNLILDGYRYSYAKLSYLYKSGKLTKEQLLDLKAQKQGFKNHYERVLMRYMEVVKSYKYKNTYDLFKDAKEKHRLFKQMKSMESFLRQKEIEKEVGLGRNYDTLHITTHTMEGCC